MKKVFLALALIALYILHQDVWFWRTAHPLAFGFLPIGLFYHACYTVATSLVLLMLVKVAWPRHLEEEIERAEATNEAVVNQDIQEDRAI
jgi:Protein of unknown function (DUF3311)